MPSPITPIIGPLSESPEHPSEPGALGTILTAPEHVGGREVSREARRALLDPHGLGRPIFQTG